MDYELSSSDDDIQWRRSQVPKKKVGVARRKKVEVARRKKVEVVRRRRSPEIPDWEKIARQRYMAADAVEVDPPPSIRLTRDLSISDDEKSWLRKNAMNIVSTWNGHWFGNIKSNYNFEHDTHFGPTWVQKRLTDRFFRTLHMTVMGGPLYVSDIDLIAADSIYIQRMRLEQGHKLLLRFKNTPAWEDVVTISRKQYKGKSVLMQVLIAAAKDIVCFVNTGKLQPQSHFKLRIMKLNTEVF